MDKPTSILLDLLRFLAALAVFFQHVEQLMHEESLSFLGSFGHDAVLFFFILSGYVIGYVSSEKEFTFKRYMALRLIRLYSVAIPALIVAIALWFLAAHLNLGSPIYSESFSFAKVIFGSLFFLNQSWGWGQNLPTLGPYWSIGHEFWYYFLFGIFFYLKGRPRLFLAIVFSVVAGPGVLLLFPIWLVGYLLYRHSAVLQLKPFYAAILAVVSMFIYGFARLNNYDDYLYQIYSVAWGGDHFLNQHLGYGKKFLADYMLSVLQAMFLVAILSLRFYIYRVLRVIENPVKNLAASTFAIYLFHYPLIIFLSGFSVDLWMLFLLIAVAMVPLHHSTEFLRLKMKFSIQKL